MKKTAVALSVLVCSSLLLAFVLPNTASYYVLDMDGANRVSQEEAVKSYDLQEKMKEKLQQLSYEAEVTISQGGAGCFVWVCVSSVVESETQAEEIAQTICEFGAEFSSEAITITDWEGATWWKLSENWSKTLISA